MSPLSFLAPPPGLAPHVAFALEPVEAAEGLFTLTAVADPEVRLFAVDPATVMPDYAPVLSDEQAESLALESPDDATLFVVAQLTDEGIGVNLLAPVVVNHRTGSAAQVILEGQDLPVRALLR
ncbi:MAG: flagellar assembly protein FliW [Candidatus Microbacterium phytovorans]|uniref:Flagellar assembly protein FliW n=1 Tax=Candidatus Microbacterium phytovorans TaxID=3121374 RepID=A0AAJ5W1T7_9MICO|nr:flagellar assembly protein FliW [Microbacterium sp.]WEK13051.1 MAG: flagellar assembly protein FliW [Microbacterium sp.]